MTAVEKLEGLVVIDEIQRRPDLFPILRVLSDREPLRARFLILGSASPSLLRQSSESLAGRLERVVISGKRVGIEVKRSDAPRLTPSMRTALTDLKLDRLMVVYPGDRRYPLADRVDVIPADSLAALAE